MENNYPIISLSTKYKQILASDPPLPDPPVEPEKPHDPTKPSPSSGEGCMSTGFVIGFLALMIIFLFYAANNDNLGNVIFFSICGILVAIGILAFNYFLQNDAKKKYPERLRNYQLELTKYNTDLRSYETVWTDYLNKLTLYNENVNKLKSPGNVIRYRLNLLRKFDDEITMPSEDDSIVTKGASENFFYTYLSKYFGNNIHQNKILNQDELNLFPDFTYLNNERNLCIDIEIDEPYVGSNGNPIHHTESNDNWRDDFFNSHGWAVIRLAEEQVVNQPDSCCQLIEKFIRKYLSIDPIQKDKLLNSTGIKPIPSWTKDEAHRLAFRRYRLSYLPTNLQSKIKDESFDTHLTVEDEIIEKWRRKNDPIEDDLPF
jgi:hypothetical protein